jgi:enolase
MSAITEVTLRRIYDSRGKETVEATIRTEDRGVGVAGAPSGASTGTHEVKAFPTGGVASVLSSAAPTLYGRLKGLDSAHQAGFDAALHDVDGTADFATIGGNTATALSLACAMARADEADVPLWRLLKRPEVDGKTFPAIVGNSLNGGRHAVGGPDIQEYIAYSSAARPQESVPAALAVHHAIGEALHQKMPTHAMGRGDEGGWVAPVGNFEALEILSDACARVRDRLRVPVYPGLDLAASEFFREGKYHYRERSVDAEGQLALLTDLVDRYEVRYLEDPFDQEDFASFAALTKAVGGKTLVVGDDLYATALARVERGAAEKSSNAVLIKVATIDFARGHCMETVASHRSGDLPQGWLAHLAVAAGSAGIKCGLLGGERVAKLNELLGVAAATGAD